ncbi:PorV/PorQ family protein [bacterium]|nr:PorV/PorQ family protein [bacterium]
MKKMIIMTVVLVLCFSLYGGENKKIAQTGFQFLSVQSDARAVAMGGAVNSLEMKSGALFFNPATMAHMDEFVSVSFSLNEWIADINHNQLTVALNPAHGQLGVFGLSFQNVDYGELQGTVVNPLAGSGFEYTDKFSPSAQSLGLGYAKAITDRFAIGGQVKWVSQDLGKVTYPSVTTGDTLTKKNDLSLMAYDFGTLFRTGWKSLAFGMSVRHFSRETEFVLEGFQLPLVFTIGASMDLMDLWEIGGIDQSLIVSVDGTHYRSHPEQLLVGLDYTLMNMLSLRAGLVTGNDEENVSYGVGVSRYGFMIDYAYTPFGVFDKVQRFTVRMSL